MDDERGSAHLVDDRGDRVAALASGGSAGPQDTPGVDHPVMHLWSDPVDPVDDGLRPAPARTTPLVGANGETNPGPGRTDVRRTQLAASRGVVPAAARARARGDLVVAEQTGAVVVAE